MQYLGLTDWIWLTLFVLLMVGTGVAFYRLARRSEEDFFLAGRRLPWWLPAVSVYATHTATDTPIFVTGIVFLCFVIMLDGQQRIWIVVLQYASFTVLSVWNHFKERSSQCV